MMASMYDVDAVDRDVAVTDLWTACWWSIVARHVGTFVIVEPMTLAVAMTTAT